MSKENSELLNRMPVEIGSNQLELVDFRIRCVRSSQEREELFGINVSKVTELLYLPDRVVAVPGALSAQLGMISLRGKTIPVFDMGGFLNLPGARPITSSEPIPNLTTSGSTPPTLIVTEFSRLILGFAVHRVALIRRCSWSSVQPTDTRLSASADTRRLVGTVLVDPEELRGANTSTEKDILQIVDLEAIADEAGFFQKQKEETEATEQETPRHKTILVADDSATARHALVKLLERLGYTIIQATDGKIALDILTNSAHSIDMLITDIEMPEMDGYSLTKQVRLNPKYKNLPILINSSMSGTANHKKGTQAGANDYLVKLDPKTLTEAVSKWF